MRLKILFIFTLLIGVIFFASTTKIFAQNSSGGSSGSNSSSNNSSSSSSSRTGGVSSSRSLGSGNSSNSSFSIDTNAVQAVRSVGTLSDTSSSGFVGGASDFIGASSSTSGSSSRSSYSTSSMRRSSSLSSSRNRNNQSGMYGNRGTNSQTQLQPAYTLGFIPVPTDYKIVTTALSTRINRVNNIGKLGDIQVNMNEGVAVLRGDVKTEHDRKVAENMARLQPGVKSVRSEISISATPAIQTE